MKKREKQEYKEKQQKTKSWKKNLKITACTVAFPVVMFLLLSPVEVYESNITDFDFMWYDFLYGFLLTALVMFAVAVLLLSFLPEKANRMVLSVIFAGSVMSYLQNMLLNVKIAEIDGSEMNWDELKGTTVLNSILWIIGLAGILALCICLKKYRDRILCYGSAFLGLIQFAAYISCIVTILNSGKMPSECTLSSYGRFTVAPEKNVIVLVLDSVSNEVFDRAIEEKPEIKEELKDFTYYSNYDSLYVPTFPSMSHLLTGDDPELSSGRYSWLESAWNSQTCTDFYNTLHEDNYTCYLYGSMLSFVYGSSSYLQGKFDNVENYASYTNYRLMYPMMAKYTIYRYAPYIVKPKFEVIQSHYQGVVYYEGEAVEIDDTNDYFYEGIKSQGVKIDDALENAFIVDHLSGLHAPKIINENAEVVEDEVTDEQVVEGCFTIIGEYLEQLKELGVYEDATVIILADHGTHHGTDRQAVFLIKESGSTGSEMQTSTAPITSDEFQATVMYSIGEDSSAYGDTIYDWDDGEKRERTSYYLHKGDIDKLEGYTYSTDRNELKEKLEGDPDVVK